MPRPTKYTPARVDVILRALRAGNTRMASAGVAGVGYQTFVDWLHRRVGFREQVEQAEHEAEAWFLSRVRIAAGQGDSKSAQWWLERRRRPVFGPETRTVLAGDPDAPVEVMQKVMVVDGPSDPEERLTNLARTLDLLASVGVVVEPGKANGGAAAPRTSHRAKVDEVHPA